MVTIDTRKVQRRELKFKCIDCVRGELDRIDRAHHAGTLGTLGNWTPGQILGHLASWISYAYDGYPPGFKGPPAFMKLLLKLMKNRFIRQTLPAGFSIRGVEGGTYGIEPRSVEDGLRFFREQLDRLERSGPTPPNPVFGLLTHEEWTALHLRHAELHLGFLTLS